MAEMISPVLTMLEQALIVPLKIACTRSTPGLLNRPEDVLHISKRHWNTCEDGGEKYTRDDPRRTYCNGGIAATTVLFCLAMLAYPRLANYDGSWNEWGRRPDLPVE